MKPRAGSFWKKWTKLVKFSQDHQEKKEDPNKWKKNNNENNRNTKRIRNSYMPTTGQPRRNKFLETYNSVKSETRRPTQLGHRLISSSEIESVILNSR